MNARLTSIAVLSSLVSPQEPLQAPQDDATRGAVVEALEGISAKLRSGGKRSSDWFDVERLMQMVEGPTARPSSFRRGLLEGVRESFEQLGEDELYVLAEPWVLRSMAVESDRSRASVVVRSRDEDAVYSYARIWLAHSKVGWQIYDFEDLLIGLRTSEALVEGLGDPLKGLASNAFFHFLDKSGDALWEEDLEAAEKAQKRLAALDVSPTLEALYWLHVSQLRELQGLVDEALTAVDEANALTPDLPAADYRRAVLHNVAGQHERAIEAAFTFQEKLGSDPDLEMEIGGAYEALGKTNEAFAAYARGLADDASAINCLLGMCRVAQPDDLDELRRGFASFPDGPGYFDEIAGEAIDVDAWSVLEALCAELDVRAPDDPNVEYYTAERLSFEDKDREAAEVLLSALPRAGDEREIYLDAYLDYCVWAEESAWGYAQVPGDAAYAFGYLASQLLEMDPPALDALIDQHAEVHPDDPWSHFWLGRQHQAHGRVDAAEAAYLEASELDDASAGAPGGRALADAVLEWRVDNLVADGRVDTAYALEPRESAWRWILDSCFWSDLGPALEVALELRRADRPDDPELAAWSGFAAWLLDDMQVAADRLDEADLGIEPLAPYVDFLEHIRLESILGTGRHDRALIRAREIGERSEDPTPVLRVHLAMGDLEATIAGLRQCLAQGMEWEDLVDEVGEGIEALREKVEGDR